MTRHEQVLETARAEWEKTIKEPAGKEYEPSIDSYIRSESGLFWHWEKPYEKNGQFQWCGAFAAYCFGTAGLKKALRLKHCASTFRLFSWAAGNKRWIDPKDLIPGDIVVVAPVDGKRYGNHICIAEKVDEVGVDTIEGNASGEFPDGSRGEGVIRQRRLFDRKSAGMTVLYGVRPLEEDYE